MIVLSLFAEPCVSAVWCVTYIAGYCLCMCV